MKRFYDSNIDIDKDRSLKHKKKLEEDRIEMINDLSFDVNEGDIYHLFGHLHVTTPTNTSAFPVQNTSLWQSKIRRYFPYLEHTKNIAFKEDPLELFSSEYSFFKKIAVQLLSDNSIIIIEPILKYFLFALSGQCEKIASAELGEIQENILYMLAASNGHTLAFDKLTVEYLAVALCLAASKGNYQSVEVLLTTGITSEVKEEAFSRAAYNGHFELAIMLLKKLSKEQIYQSKNLGVLIYSFALHGPFNGFLDVFRELNISKELQNAAAEVAFDIAARNGKPHVFNTLLMSYPITNEKIADAIYTAISWEHYDMAKELLLQWPDIPTKTADLLLQDCASKGRLDDLIMLLEAYPKITNRAKDLALCFSAIEGHAEIVRELLTHPTCKVITDDIKGNALFRAMESGNVETLKVLLKYIKKTYDLLFCTEHVEYAV